MHRKVDMTLRELAKGERCAADRVPVASSGNEVPTLEGSVWTESEEFSVEFTSLKLHDEVSDSAVPEEISGSVSTGE